MYYGRVAKTGEGINLANLRSYIKIDRMTRPLEYVHKGIGH